MNEISDISGSAPQKAAPPAEAEDKDPSLDQLLSDISALETVSETWDDVQKNTLIAHIKAIEALNAQAFKNLIRTLKADTATKAALREAVSDDTVYAVLRRHGILKPNLFEQVETALDTIRPMLESHGGDVELVSVEPPVAKVRFVGACDGCPASALTFYSGVKKAIQDNVPEIDDIQQIKGLGGGGADTVHFSSPFANYKSGSWAFAIKLGELPEGETKILTIADHSIMVSRFGDRVTCFENACAHMGMAMDGGEFADGLITCPYHGFKYSLESGECLTAPEVQLQPHGVRVVGDRVEVQLTS